MDDEGIRIYVRVIRQLSGIQLKCDRQNQSLEQDSAAMQEEQARLEQEAHSLTQHMEALMHDKFELSASGFDAETPIEKVLNLMHAFITQVNRPLVVAGQPKVTTAITS